MDYKVMIVAGEGTSGLEKDIKTRDAVEVTHAFNNLITHKDEINTSIVDITKLIYIIQDEDMPVREDLSLLGELLTKSKSYFKVREILFLIRSSEDLHQQQEYIKLIMKDSNYDEYEMIVSEDAFSYIDIYKHALGTTELVKVTNKKKIVYMVERESDVNRAYEPRVSDNKIKPYSYSELEEYEKLKQTSVDTESGRLIEDRYIDNVAKYRNSPDFKSISEENILIDKNTLIFTGRSNSGLTTFALRTCLSAMAYAYKILYVNLSDNKDIIRYCRDNDVLYRIITIKDLLDKNKIRNKEEELIILDLSMLSESLKITSVAELVNSTGKFNANLFVYEMGTDTYPNIIELVKDNISRIFFTTLPYKKDIFKLKKLINKIVTEDKKIVHGFIPDIMISDTFCKPSDREELKKVLDLDKVLLIQYEEENFNPGPGLFKGMMEV